jgi:oxygen-independent coproporphyrinogen-3 oxidase
VSNWSAPGGECQHNIAYWKNADWWGIGPGAHSHVAGTRWWNVKHPARYAAALAAGESVRAGEETLTREQRTLEDTMLGIRMRGGLPAAAYASEIDALLDDGLVEFTDEPGYVALTLKGRLVADAVVRELIP